MTLIPQDFFSRPWLFFSEDPPDFPFLRHPQTLEDNISALGRPWMKFAACSFLGAATNVMFTSGNPNNIRLRRWFVFPIVSRLEACGVIEEFFQENSDRFCASGRRTLCVICFMPLTFRTFKPWIVSWIHIIEKFRHSKEKVQLYDVEKIQPKSVSRLQMGLGH